MAQPVNIPYTITSKYGERSAPTAGASSNHAGIDISVPRGTLVTSTEAGTIQSVGSNNARGNYISVLYDSGYNGIYQHLDSSLVKAGQRVAEGAALGLSGNTGISTGPHLHFEVKDTTGKTIDPELYLKNMNTNSGKMKADPNRSGASGIAAALPDLPNITGFLKQYWIIIAAALVVVGILKK